MTAMRFNRDGKRRAAKAAARASSRTFGGTMTAPSEPMAVWLLAPPEAVTRGERELVTTVILRNVIPRCDNSMIE